LNKFRSRMEKAPGKFMDWGETRAGGMAFTCNNLASWARQ
jgi:hypothetical protein